MSITNYFGKPRTKYVPYKSPYTFDNFIWSDTDKIISFGGLNDPDEVTTRAHTPQPLVPNFVSNIHYEDIESYKSLYGANTYALNNIQYMFNELLKKCMKWIEQPLWGLNKLTPVINIYHIIILKLSHVDKHVEHHEKIIASLCEDNLSLNNRIKELEQRYEHQSHIPVAEPITVAEAVLKL